MDKKTSNRFFFLFSITIFTFGQVLLFVLDIVWYLQIIFGLLFIGIISAGLRYQAYIFIMRVVTPISIGLLSMLIYEYAYSFEISSQFLDASFKVSFHIERFFEVLAILYAVITAFLLWKGLTDHDLLKQTLNAEASTIRSIVSYTTYFDRKKGNNHLLVNNIRNNFAMYINHIMKDGSIKTNNRNNTILEQNINNITQLSLSDKNDEIALAIVMQRLGELSSYKI